ncbi:toll/interleukin-1 receptor domain-containing protein [Streptomyces sp. NPDC002265]|uniref:toll/interleukin-1 receptor domain-containing protein n=1 Tax=Streptomyces sp. NPDC002265 TaxID=3154415 RepID=UPI00332F0D95
MQIFISWSGDMAKQCAEALRDWLPYMNQAITPFVSSQDISKGERGLSKIASQLQECSLGIVCVTRDNQSAPWINFESGALSRELGESSLIPFLVDMPIKDLSGPITQFQATDSSNKGDVWSMIKSINDKCEVTVEPDRLRTTFERFWGDLETNLVTIREKSPESTTPERETSEILNELVGLVREQSTRIGALETIVTSIRNISSHYAINEPREVRITNETGNTRRTSRVANMVREMIGTKNITRMKKTDYGLEIYCTEQGVSNAQGVHSDLERLAADQSISISIYSESGGYIHSHPPF